MATPLQPKRILQLLKICSWKSENPLTFSGFSTLESNISGHQIKTGKTDYPNISQKYLNDLLLDIQKKMDSGETVGRNVEYINEIVDYFGFADWKTFEHKMSIINGFVDPAKIDFSAFKELKIAVFCHANLHDKIQPTLAYPKKTLEIDITTENTRNTEAEAILTELLKASTKYPFVIWIIDNDWNEIIKTQTDSENLKQIWETGGIIPIRVGETLSEKNLRTSILDKDYNISGETGILMALSAIENAIQHFSESEKKGTKTLGISTKIDTLNNSGTLFLGENKQNITGENVALGNFIQNINKKED